MFVIKSPLAAWQGSFSLPSPDDFNRDHWDTYQNGYNKPKRESYSMFHISCYTGLELVAAYGEWDMHTVTVDEETGEEKKAPLSLSTVRSWEDDPAAEKTKLVAFIGHRVYHYIEAITNPKG